MTAPVATTAPPPATSPGSLLAKLEIDSRMIGMLAALAIIWIGFDVLSGGVFLTPRNLWNLSVQTASVAVMSTGMVLIIVTRNIDLSVGAILGVVGMIIGVAQTRWLPGWLGFEHWLTAPAAVLVAVTVGGAHRPVPGLAHRLPGDPLLHRDARRAAGLARRGLVGHRRADRRAHGHALQGVRRRRRGGSRRHRDLGHRRARLRGDRGRRWDWRAAAGCASAFRSARAGPTW